ncbi:MAG TPA: hypothetical protein VMK05_01445 [Burkholderiales bacterium]|nr:hypothetical protein [Burkholderiales bacterium]
MTATMTARAVLLLIAAGAGVAPAPVAHAADVMVVPSELWDRPRTGRAVLDTPSVRRAVQLLLARPNATLIIHHGRGQEPQLAAEELRAWLVALAVEAARVSLNNDLQSNELRLEVTP